MDKKYSIYDLLDAISEKVNVIGEIDRYILKPSPIHKADEDSLSFCSKDAETAFATINKSNAKVIICSSKLYIKEKDCSNKTLIMANNPRLAFIQVLRKYFDSKCEKGISSTSKLDKKAEIHPSVHIGDFSYIGDCKIGSGSVIHENVFIYDKVEIGKNVTPTLGNSSEEAFVENSAVPTER